MDIGETPQCRNVRPSCEEDAPKKGELEQIIWPCFGGENREYKLVQVKLGDTYYYRFYPAGFQAETSPKTGKIALKMGGEDAESSSHLFALDLFVKELLANGHEPGNIIDVRGCNASYNSMGELTFSGKSSKFGRPDYDQMMLDMALSQPEGIELLFETE